VDATIAAAGVADPAVHQSAVASRRGRSDIRRLFTGAEPLDRARFPKNVARARVPLDWLPPPEEA